MKAFKSDRIIKASATEIPVSEAVAKVKKFNAEFCADLTDDEIIRQLCISPIYTNLSKYWIEDEQKEGKPWKP